MLIFPDMERLVDIPIFLGWTLASAGLGRALLRSFPSLELKSWLLRRNRARLAALPRLVELSYELEKKRRWPGPRLMEDKLSSRGDPLTKEEWNSARLEYEGLARASLGLRAILWLLECWACQVFWGAAIWSILPGWRIILVMASLFAISELVVMVSRVSARENPFVPSASSKTQPCGGGGST